MIEIVIFTLLTIAALFLIGAVSEVLTRMRDGEIWDRY